MVIGGLLHDIGTYYVLKKKHNGSNGEPLEFSKKRYILHGLLGYEYLLEEGVDESIAQFARNHTGVGLTRESVIAQGLPLPPDDYVPLNLEQESVMVADKYHSKSVPPKFVSADAYTARAARFGEDNKRRWLDLVREYGMPDVPALAEHWHHAHDLIRLTRRPCAEFACGQTDIASEAGDKRSLNGAICTPLVTGLEHNTVGKLISGNGVWWLESDVRA